MKTIRVLGIIITAILFFCFPAWSQEIAAANDSQEAQSHPEIAPQAVTALMDGDYYLDLGDYDSAIMMYEQAIDIAANQENPASFSEAYNNLGVAYYRQGQYNRAKENFETAFNSYEIFEAIVNLGFMFYFAGDADAANSRADKAIDMDPESHVAYNLKGLCNVLAHNWSAAESSFNTAIQKASDPDQKAMYKLSIANLYVEKERAERNLLNSQAHTDNYNNADSAVSAAGALLGDDMDSNPYYLSHKGWIRHYFRMNLEEAIEIYQQAIALEPESIYLNGALHYNLACVYAMRGVDVVGDEETTLLRELVFGELEAALQTCYAFSPAGNNRDYDNILADPDLLTIRLKFEADFVALLDQYRCCIPGDCE